MSINECAVVFQKRVLVWSVSAALATSSFGPRAALAQAQQETNVNTRPLVNAAQATSRATRNASTFDFEALQTQVLAQQQMLSMLAAQMANQQGTRVEPERTKLPENVATAYAAFEQVLGDRGLDWTNGRSVTEITGTLREVEAAAEELRRQVEAQKNALMSVIDRECQGSVSPNMIADQLEAGGTSECLESPEVRAAAERYTESRKASRNATDQMMPMLTSALATGNPLIIGIVVALMVLSSLLNSGGSEGDGDGGESRGSVQGSNSGTQTGTETGGESGAETGTDPSLIADPPGSIELSRRGSTIIFRQVSPQRVWRLDWNDIRPHRSAFNADSASVDVGVWTLPPLNRDIVFKEVDVMNEKVTVRMDVGDLKSCNVIISRTEEGFFEALATDCQ